MNPVPPPPPDVSRRHYKILPQGTRQTPTGIAFFPSEGFFWLHFSPHSIQKLNATLLIGRGGEHRTGFAGISGGGRRFATVKSKQTGIGPQH